MTTTQLTLDSSEISTFLECPRKWYYQYRLHRRKFGRRKALNKGSLFHAFLEAYYQDPTWSHCQELMVLILKAKEEARLQPKPDAIIHPDGKEEILGDPLLFISPTIRILKEKYNLKLDEDKYDLEQADFDLVFSRFAEYVKNYQGHDFKVAKGKEGTPGIELGFAIKIGEYADFFPTIRDGFNCTEARITSYILDGRIDLLVEYENHEGLVWVDHKTESQSRDLYEKRIQFRNYDLAVNFGSESRGLGVINYLGLQQKPTPKTFRRALCPFTGKARSHWNKYLIERVYNQVRELDVMAEKDPNFFSCESKYGLCDYTQVCDFEDEPDRMFELQSQYIQVEPWRPW